MPLLTYLLTDLSVPGVDTDVTVMCKTSRALVRVDLCEIPGSCAFRVYSSVDPVRRLFCTGWMERSSSGHGCRRVVD